MKRQEKEKKMAKTEIIIAACKVADLLYAAQPGQGSLDARKSAREEANSILEKMPKNWWRKVPDEVTSAITALA